MNQLVLKLIITIRIPIPPAPDAAAMQPEEPEPPAHEPDRAA